jgi:CubicO group peptidase (beta-lactamase class C family)
MRKKAIAMLLLLMLLPFHAYAAETRAANLEAQITAFMEQALDRYQIPGASLAVLRKGEIIYRKNWGTMSDGAPVTSDTPFLIGSVSKPLTALAVMMLVQDGRLQLDEPIGTYLPEFTYRTKSEKAITVRHLLEQTSGIGEFAGLAVTDRPTRGEDAIARAVRKLSGVSLSHAPGEVYEYNSANYLLLGAIVESVSNMPFSRFMESRIFSPLGMNDAAADYRTAVGKGLVPGYQSWFGRPVKSSGLYDDSGAPYGYIAASANDLVQFMKFMLYGGALLSEQHLKLLTSPPAGGNRYGFGWHFSVWDHEKYPFHVGATPDYRAEIFFMPEHDWGAVLLINKYHELEAVPYLSLMNGIRSILDGKAPNLAAMNHAAQWSLSGIVILFAASAVLGLIRLARKPGIDRRRRLSLAIIAVVSALALIPLFSYCIGVPWRSIALFAPDIALLIRSLAAIFAFHGIASILLIAWKGKSNG